MLPITGFRKTRCRLEASLFGCFDPRVVAMLAEIFIIRLEAERRLAQEVLPSGAFRLIPFVRRANSLSRKRTKKLRATSRL